MILLIDNYDSFTYNLYQYFSEMNAEVKVVRNDRITVPEIEQLAPSAILISPGPGLPDEAGNCLDIVRHFHEHIPIIGICLGHQVIGEALGGRLRQAKEIKHGKTSLVTHNGLGAFRNMENPIEVMRYHSYVIDEQNLPEQLQVTWRSIDDNEIMAVKHRTLPLYGLQFHPESIGTETGKQMIRNMLNEIIEELLFNEIPS